MERHVPLHLWQDRDGTYHGRCPAPRRPGSPPGARPLAATRTHSLILAPSSLRQIYYGWVLAGGLGLTTTVSWGIVFYAFSVFLQPMEAELGWSRAQLSGAFTVALLVSGGAAVPLGRWIDRHGARTLMTAGSCAGTLLLLAWAAVQDLALFYVLWIAMGLVMAATLYDPAFAVIASWFRRGRSRALTLVTLMAGLASTIFLPLAAWLVELQGWRTALVSLAAILAVTTVPVHALLLRRRPEDLGLRPDGEPATGSRGSPPGAPLKGPLSAGSATIGSAPSIALDSATGKPTAPATQLSGSVRRLLGHAPFRWLVVAYCLSGLASGGLGVHLVLFLSERGLPLTIAATATGLVGAAQVLGRIAFAPLERVLPRRWLTALVLLAQPLAMLALLAGSATVGMYFFILLFGVSRGAATLARANHVAARYGAAQYGSVNGTLSLFVTLAHAFAPLILGATHDLQGTYEPALWVMTALSVVACGAIFLSDPPGTPDQED